MSEFLGSSWGPESDEGTSHSRSELWQAAAREEVRPLTFVEFVRLLP